MEFNFAPVVSHHKREAKPKESTIVSKDVTGVIHINLDASYYINVTAEPIPLEFPLSINSYNCKNKEILFYKGLFNNNTLKTIRLNRFNIKDIFCYLPFAVGSYCKGNLIKENGIVKFDLKKIINYCEVVKQEDEKVVVYDDKIKKEVVEAITFFRLHYEEIRTILDV